MKDSKQEFTETHRRLLYRLGGIASFLQLGTLLATVIILGALGESPTTAEAYFAVLQQNKLVGLLQTEVYLLVLVGLYLLLFPGLYLALRPVHRPYALLSALFTFVAVTCLFASHPGFSLLHLSERYAAATSPAARAQLLAAGEALIAANGWNSSAGYMSGLLLQGAGVIISIVMLRSRDFSKVTAYSGLLANAIDLVQHLLHPFAPELAAAILPFSGPFYLVWFPMLGWELLRLARRGSRQASHEIRPNPVPNS